jgi:hypothetical protein
VLVWELTQIYETMVKGERYMRVGPVYSQDSHACTIGGACGCDKNCIFNIILKKKNSKFYKTCTLSGTHTPTPSSLSNYSQHLFIF